MDAIRNPLFLYDLVSSQRKVIPGHPRLVGRAAARLETHSYTSCCPECNENMRLQLINRRLIYRWWMNRSTRSYIVTCAPCLNPFNLAFILKSHTELFGINSFYLQEILSTSSLWSINFLIVTNVNTMASVSDQVSVTIVHEASAFERLASRCDQDFLDKHDLDSLLSLNKRHLFGKP